MKLTRFLVYPSASIRTERLSSQEVSACVRWAKPDHVDADTRYMVASNTKAMATLMLAKLVDQGISWDSPAAPAFAIFKLGEASTTSKVLVKHFICACTGMPRQDLEWLLEFKGMTPDSAMRLLGTMQPTSGFGELFQYSNPMAAAAGFIGGHVVYPGWSSARPTTE